MKDWWAFFSCTKLGLHRWCGTKLQRRGDRTSMGEWTCAVHRVTNCPRCT